MNDPSGPARVGSKWTDAGHWVRRVSPTRWLMVAVAVYFVVSFALSWLRAIELQTTTWDMGIYQQALWSAAHGQPFTERVDFETGGYRSLLQIHTVFLFYLIAPVYGALPSEVTLLAIQSAAVALAAVPLYFLGKDLGHSPRLGLVVAIAYLVWTPVLSANLFDFHPETFLPVELFTVVLLWERERYWAGAAAVAVAFATLELAPVLVFFIGLFFLLPSRASWAGWPRATPRRARWTTWRARLSSALSSPRVRASLALVAASLAVYYLLVYYRVDYLASTLGGPSGMVVPPGYVIGATPSALGLSVQNVSIGFSSKLTYWLLLLALLGFVPLLAPRALVLSVPWFAFTLSSANPNFVTLGDQYGAIAAASILVAFAYGLPLAARWLDSLTIGASPSSPPSMVGRPNMDRERWTRGLALALIVLVGVNLALSPANPLMDGQGVGGGYQISYSPSSGFEDVESVAALVPANATVIASNDLFPLVANDENAYSLYFQPTNFLQLPFNASHVPNFVFIASDRTSTIPTWLGDGLYNQSRFGARGVAWVSSPGPVLLFESGYHGPTEVYGAPPALPLDLNGGALVNVAAGYTVNDPEWGSVSTNVPGVPGVFALGPSASLPKGNYTAKLWVSAATLAGAPSAPGSEPVLQLEASAFGQPPNFDVVLDRANLSTSGWTELSYDFTLYGPTIQFNLEGVALATNVQVALAALEIVSH